MKDLTTLTMVWTLICAFLVMFMQAGFALVATGFCRAKNASHTMAMNLMICCLGPLGYWACGFALGGRAVPGSEVALHLFGRDLGLLGCSGFFLSGRGYDAALCSAFLFQAVLANVAAAIPTGALAERCKFSAFVIYGLVMSGVIYPLYANWVWGGGWLAGLGGFGLGHGQVDFAGASVVHLTGGAAALAGALVLGPRLGKFTRDGLPNPMPGHHIPMAVLGTLVLAFGWFGFTAGAGLAAADSRIAVVAVNTLLSGAAGGFAAMLVMWRKYGKPDLTVSANGLLGGLVAISAPCAFVGAGSAVLIGAVAGTLCCFSVVFVERALRVDDPVGVVTVHGVCGAWGSLAVGLFADGSYGSGWNGVAAPVRGLLYGDAGQFAAQALGVGTNLLYVFGVSWFFFKALDRTIGIRVAPDVEREGLDQYEVAAAAYPEFNLRQLSFFSGSTGKSR